MNYFKVFMNVDEQLINKKTTNKEDTTEAEKAGEYLAQKRGGTPQNTGQEGANLREAVQQKRNQTADEKKKESSNVLSSKPKINPILKITDESLKGAWTNLLTSWGLTLIWIDIHAFLNKVFGPKFFRDLGEEWVPDEIKKIGGEKTKTEAALLRTLESAGCGCLNLGCLFLIITILVLVALIVKFFTGNPLETISALFGALWGYIKS